jgi:hypothetical protein
MIETGMIENGYRFVTVARDSQLLALGAGAGVAAVRTASPGNQLPG